MTSFFSDESPDNVPLETRLQQAGLLPGDQAWEDDILSYAKRFLEDWITDFRIETPEDRIVYQTGIAQIRRLLPNMTQRERDLVRVGMTVMQGWLYTYLTVVANQLQGGRFSQQQLALLNYMEYRLTTLCTLIEQMGDDLDMSVFEEGMSQ